MKRNELPEELAVRAAQRFRGAIGGPASFQEPLAETAIVLGTGWGGKLALAEEQSVELMRLAGFENLTGLSGHRRTLRYGRMSGKPILVLDGRVHLNEMPVPGTMPQMVRLQVEMLFHLGVKTLILTCAAGALRSNLCVGDLLILDGFVTLFAPPMPLWGGEFCAPEDALSAKFRGVAATAAQGLFRHHHGGYAMVRGPQFEGRKYDKKILAATGAQAVGMSMLPETCIAALYGVRVLGLCFITNSATEEHSHEENVRRANAKEAALGTLLERIVAAV